MLNVSSESGEEVTNEQEGTLNRRASYLSGQIIYGDAILASIGYTWKSTDILYEDVSLRSFYRYLLSFFLVCYFGINLLLFVMFGCFGIHI